ncbi:hypothetical protein [Mesomycoplasma conjunctivae]|uniref:hypothetical protein n=1 Tax=Mesomycoplasma conjunctivae TaxID=45361 RepID=UPI003DA59F55
MNSVFDNILNVTSSDKKQIEIYQKQLETKRIIALKEIKLKHPEYWIDKHRIRTIHTIYGTIKVKITYLSKPTPNSNKRQVFAFYHDDFLKINKGKQYDVEFINRLNIVYFAHKRIDNIYNKIPTIALLRHYLKQTKIPLILDLKSQNQTLLNEHINAFKHSENQLFKLEIDDTFLKFNNHTKRLKHKIRMLILHPIDQNTTNINYSKTIAFYVIEPTNNNQNKPIKELAAQLKTVLQQCSIYPSKLLINGYGARWMKTLKNEFKCILKLDEFHLKHQLKKLLLVEMEP